MPDTAEVVFWRPADPGESPATGTGPPDLSEAARWLAAAPGASGPDLDAALMAWLGPGPCVELATIVTVPSEPVGGTTPQGVSLARALELAPAVLAHVGGCPACSDRLCAMVSVGELVRREAPSEEGASPGGSAPAPARSATPPGPDGHRRRRARVTAPAVAAAVLAVGAAGGIAYLAWPSTQPGGTPAHPPVPAIGRLPAGGSSLVLDPAATTAAVLHLSDVGRRGVTWQAATTAPWLRVSPAAGHLEPGQSVNLALDVVGNQGAGLRATVTVNGNDGSVAAASYRP